MSKEKITLTELIGMHELKGKNDYNFILSYNKMIRDIINKLKNKIKKKQ